MEFGNTRFGIGETTTAFNPAVELARNPGLHCRLTSTPQTHPANCHGLVPKPVLRTPQFDFRFPDAAMQEARGPNCGKRWFRKTRQGIAPAAWLKPEELSTGNWVRDFLEACHRHPNTTVVANAFDNFAVVVHLPQFSLGIKLVATVNHQVFHNHAHAGAYTKGVFYELMGLHKTPFTSIRSGDYMQ